MIVMSSAFFLTVKQCNHMNLIMLQDILLLVIVLLMSLCVIL